MSNALSRPQEITVILAGSNWGHKFIPNEDWVYVSSPKLDAPQEWQRRRVIGFYSIYDNEAARGCL